MSVGNIMTLPLVGTAGNAREIGLGGDGMTAPKNQVLFRIAIPNDGSAGNAGLTVYLDRRYTSVVDWLMLKIVSGTADQEFNMQVEQWLTPTGNVLVATEVQGHVRLNPLTTTTSVMWMPPVDVLTPNLPTEVKVDATTENIVGSTSYLYGKVLQYDRQAREKTPQSVFISNLTPRSAGAIYQA